MGDPRDPGVLSYTAAGMGIPAVGAEVSGMGGCLEADVALYREGLRRVLALTGILPGDDGPLPDVPATIWGGDWLLSPAGGHFRPRVALEDDVQAGDLLAEILDPFGDPLAEVRAAAAGRVLGIRHLRSIGPGEWAVMVLQPGMPPERDKEGSDHAEVGGSGGDRHRGRAGDRARHRPALRPREARRWWWRSWTRRWQRAPRRR